MIISLWMWQMNSASSHAPNLKVKVCVQAEKSRSPKCPKWKRMTVKATKRTTTASLSHRDTLREAKKAATRAGSLSSFRGTPRITCLSRRLVLSSGVLNRNPKLNVSRLRSERRRRLSLLSQNKRIRSHILSC